MTKELIYEFFDDDEFLRISSKIKETEKITSGEVRVCIREKRKLTQKHKSIRKLAEEEFYKLGMQNTRDKTGILIFVLLKERKFYILADSGINEKVDQETWDTVRDNMRKKFIDGEFCNGILYAIEEIGQILSEFFPIKSDDTNELSNKVILE